MKIRSFLRRVKKWLSRNRLLGTESWEEEVRDPRGRQGRRWKLSPLLNAGFVGMLTNCRTLRAVESVTAKIAAFGGAFGIRRRVPDTTLDTLLRCLPSEELEKPFVAQVRAAWRSKSLLPDALPIGVIAFDGKTLWHGKERVHAECQEKTLQNGELRYHLRVLRAALISSTAKPCIAQDVIPASTNEMGAFPAMWRKVQQAYGTLGMFRVVSTDAGMCSHKNATMVKDDGYEYIMALKEDQPLLLCEARRLLAHRTVPDAATPWERYQGKWVQRQLWRTDEIAGHHGWTHLRQAWRVRRIVRDQHGNEEYEDRYFLSSLPWDLLSPRDILATVRAHWGIENNVFGTVDRQWREDEAPWCRQEEALINTSLLRLLAYNMLSLFRKRRLRSEKNRSMSWRELFDSVRDALWLFALAAQPHLEEGGEVCTITR